MPTDKPRTDLPTINKRLRELGRLAGPQQLIEDQEREIARLREALSKWEQNAEYLLSTTYKAVRIREGGGTESLMDSLIANYIALCETAGRKITRVALESGDE